MTQILLGGPPVDVQVNVGEALRVTGIAWSRDLAEGEPDPIDIQDVTVEVDGIPLAVTRTAAHRVPGQSTIGFSASFIVVTYRFYEIVARAVSDAGRSAVVRRRVYASSLGPLDTSLSGVATFDTPLGTTDSRATGGLIFNGSRTTVDPFFRGIDIAFPTVTTDSGTVLTSGTVKISSSAPGTFTKSTGQISLPISLLFAIRVVVNAGGMMIDATESSTLPAALTTGTSLSPSGALSLTGSPLASSGAVKLVGTGSFSGGFFDGYDGAVTYTGMVSPVP